MRRRLMFATTPFVMALALLLPATTLAGGGGYSYRVVLNYCINFPGVVFKVAFKALGTTNADRLTIDSKGQSGGPNDWVTQKVWPTVSYSFTADGTDHVLKLKRTYRGDAFSDNRIIFRLKAWNNSNLLYSQKVVSRSC